MKGVNIDDIINMYNIEEIDVEVCEDYFKDGIKFTKFMFKPRVKLCPRCNSPNTKLNGFIKRIYKRKITYGICNRTS